MHNKARQRSTVIGQKFGKLTHCFAGLELSLYFFVLSGDNDANFSFNGTLKKAMDNYEYPSSIKVRWVNFLEIFPYDPLDTPWIHCDGTSSVSELDTKFGFAMEKTMDEFDESITTDAKRISWWAKFLSVPEEEVAKIKFAMGYVTGQYENDTDCVFGNDWDLDQIEGPNQEVAFADRYAIFYRNGDLHCGMLKQLKTTEAWAI